MSTLILPPERRPGRSKFTNRTFEVYWPCDIRKFLKLVEDSGAVLLAVFPSVMIGMRHGWIIAYAFDEELSMEVLC